MSCLLVYTACGITSILYVCLAETTESKIDIQALKDKVKKAKTKKLGAPPVNPTPQTMSDEKKKKKNK